MHNCMQINSLNEVLDWVIQTMQHKVERVNMLHEQVLQPTRSLILEEVMKLKVDVVDEMDHLVHDSLQCECSMNKFLR
jgi:hypothetical protein